MKKCGFCLNIKAKDQFYINNRTKDNLQNLCKDCTKKYVLNWQKNNKQKVNAKNAAYKKKYKIWLRPKEKIHSNMRYSKLRKYTPKWADLELMRDMYLESKYQGLEVDHIIPLNSPIVCGLHWEGNLQLLSRKENSMKGNKLGY